MAIRYLITNGNSLESIGRAMEAGIEWIQIREKQLSARSLFTFVQAVLRLPNPMGAKILVNDRIDIAVACGAHGVHLRSNAISPLEVRRLKPVGFMIGVSCHSVTDVLTAEREGADFAVLGPIFETPGKSIAIGLAVLVSATQRVTMPVLALGGVTAERTPACLEAGATGVAGIRLFQDFGPSSGNIR